MVEANDSGAELVAAVDLGSNSFHAVIARLIDDQPEIIDRLRVRVHLADGLDANRNLSEDATARALECLALFGERLRDLASSQVRAVATSTLRQARNAREFLREGSAALGHPVEVISGREEARLIYHGVTRTLPLPDGRRLVIDIGGGSTEVMTGQGSAPLALDSLSMGCVVWTRRYFEDGVITRARYDAACDAASLELRPMRRRHRELGWDTAIGSSGTIRAVASALRDSGWTDGAITLDGTRRLRDYLVEAGHADAIDLPGLKPDRRPVLAGGLAILDAALRNLKVDTMDPAPGALREGVLFDLVGRKRRADTRSVTVRALVEQYHVDAPQARRVEATALVGFRRLEAGWDLGGEAGRRFLRWAARLHEIGLGIGYSHHHDHGGYILDQGDLPGFSQDDQRILAALVKSHRRKFRNSPFDQVPPAWTEPARRLAILLRIAVLLNRGRSDRPLPDIVTEATGERGLRLTFPPGWLDAHPLTRVDIEREQRLLAHAGFELTCAEG